MQPSTINPTPSHTTPNAGTPSTTQTTPNAGTAPTTETRPNTGTQTEQRVEPTPPASVTLTKQQTATVASIFDGDATGKIPAGHTVSVLDTGSADGKGRINAGDTVQVKDKDGKVVKEVKLSNDQAYEINFRSNLVKNCEDAGTSRNNWQFTADIVDIKNSETIPASEKTRTGPDGKKITVIERNKYWEVVNAGKDDRGQDIVYMKMRDPDANGKPTPSEAMNDIFNNKNNYAFDCGTPMRLMNLKATLDTVGEADFNKHYQGLCLQGEFDSHDTNRNSLDAGYVKAGETVTNKDWRGKPITEYSKFNPASDKLVPGERRYFEKPGDVTTATQGWNVIYLGPGPDGTQRFWRVGDGIHNVKIDPNSMQADGAFGTEYLSSMSGRPETQRLIDIDEHKGPQQ